MMKYYIAILSLCLLFCPILAFSQTKNVRCKGNYKDGYGKIKTETFQYEGFFFNKLPEGYGAMNTKDWSYKGYFSMGERQGIGICTFKNNNVVYSGEWERNVFVHGFVKFPNGAEYFGNFNHNKFSAGIYTYESSHPEKLKYEGNFENGYFSGYGTMTYKNGKIEDGIWELDKYMGKIVGTLNNQNVLYKDDTLYTLFDNKSYKFDEQKSYKLSSYNYFYLTNNNFIETIVLFNNTKDTVFLISNETDKELISHLNRNQYNKPAKGSLTNLCNNLYYDENNCIWILLNSEYPEILHFFRPDNNNKGIYETVLFIDSNNVQIVEETYFAQHYRFENTTDLKQQLYSGNFTINNEDFHNAGWYNYAKFEMKYDTALSGFEKALWIGYNTINNQPNSDPILNDSIFFLQNNQYISLQNIGIEIINNEFQLMDSVTFKNNLSNSILIDSVLKSYRFTSFSNVDTNSLIFFDQGNVYKLFNIEIDNKIVSLLYSQFAYYNGDYFISEPVIFIKLKKTTRNLQSRR